MKQLLLFEGGETETAPEPPASIELAPLVVVSTPLVLPGQVDLFGAWNLAVSRVRAAIAEARLEDASRELGVLVSREPANRALAGMVADVVPIADAVTRARRRKKARAEALLAASRLVALEDEPWPSFRRALTIEAAETAERELGDGAELDGQLAGRWLLEVGAVARAHDSLVRAFAARPSTAGIYLLADAKTVLAEAGAGALYLRALLADPFHPRRALAREAAIRELPSVARYEVEIEEEPTAWCAPVGIVTGALPHAPLEQELAHAGSFSAPAPSEASAAALARARAFTGALWAADASRGDRDAVVDARRAMKALCEPLFAAYMERVVRTRG